YAADLAGWSGRCRNLFVWDYPANYAHYLLPHPNWFVLGPNLRFFHRHGVVSVFAQGIDRANGGGWPGLRALLLGRLVGGPDQDDRALIDEFLTGYYGEPAAGFIRQYLELMHRELGDRPLNCGDGPGRAGFLTFRVLSEAESLWGRALQASRNDPERAWRVEQ